MKTNLRKAIPFLIDEAAVPKDYLETEKETLISVKDKQNPIIM